jgi:coenzyme F420 hydrogenase subunit delta
MAENSKPEYVKKRVLIMGCGNPLFGDDGFGPETIAYIQKNCEIPSDVHVVDVGTGASKILFILTLSEKKPERLIILDAVNVGRKPGEVFEASIEDLLKHRVSDFSSHLFPTTNLLRELQNNGVKVTILACQVEKIPEAVSPGLSEPVKKAVPKAAKIALKLAE